MTEGISESRVLESIEAKGGSLLVNTSNPSWWPVVSSMADRGLLILGSEIKSGRDAGCVTVSAAPTFTSSFNKEDCW